MMGQNYYPHWSYPTLTQTPVAFIRANRPPTMYHANPVAYNYANNNYYQPNYNQVRMVQTQMPRRPPPLPTNYNTPNLINGGVDKKTNQITRDDITRPNGNPVFTHNNGNRWANNNASRKMQNESWRKTKEEGIVPESASNSANIALKTKPTKQGIPEEITCQMRNIRISDGGNKTVKPVEEKVDNLYTYWKKRFSLFSRFQDGIMLDRESFYSVCPEVISQHIAEGCTFDIGIDPFCGAGGNIIQLAMVCKSVIAMDIDPEKIRLARHNAELYGVAGKIKFVVGDFFAIGHTMKADVLVTSPPWGGPNYSRKRVFPLADLCSSNGGGHNIMRIAKSIAPRVVLHLPKTASKEECVRLGEGFVKIKIEECHLDGRLNCLTVYYSSFAKWHVSPQVNERRGGFINTETRGPQVIKKEVQLFSKRETVFNSGPDDISKFRTYMDAVKSFLTQNMQNSDGRMVDDEKTILAPFSNIAIQKVPVQQKITHSGSTYYPTNNIKHDSKYIAREKENEHQVKGITSISNLKIQNETFEQPVIMNRNSYRNTRYKNNSTDRNYSFDDIQRQIEERLRRFPKLDPKSVSKS